MRSRPTLRYHGGKWRLAPWIISHFPEHRVYTEVFGGGGSVLMRKPRSYAEVYNDLDGEVVNVFKIVRERGAELKEFLYLTPFSRKEYLGSYPPFIPTDPLIRAARTIIKSFMGHGSESIKRQNGFRSNSNRSGTTPAHDWANWPDAVPAMIERLRGVVIEDRDAKSVLLTHDSPETLHYVDPPYVHSTRKSKHEYKFEMTDQQHVELAEVLKSLKGKVVISGYPSPLYNKLYKGWRVVKKKAMTDAAGKRVEVLWLNF